MFLRDLGIDNPPNWLTSRDSALYSVILINVGCRGWQHHVDLPGRVAGRAAGTYEAADIDGASSWTKFRHITIRVAHDDRL
ncbi:MAG: hypothetical protein R2873_22790 [Caldilineaceae bacterium]